MKYFFVLLLLSCASDYDDNDQVTLAPGVKQGFEYDIEGKDQDFTESEILSLGDICTALGKKGDSPISKNVFYSEKKCTEKAESRDLSLKSNLNDYFEIYKDGLVTPENYFFSRVYRSNTPVISSLCSSSNDLSRFKDDLGGGVVHRYEILKNSSKCYLHGAKDFEQNKVDGVSEYCIITQKGTKVEGTKSYQVFNINSVVFFSKDHIDDSIYGKVKYQYDLNTEAKVCPEGSESSEFYREERI